MRPILAFFALLASTVLASASGGIDCAANDTDVEFSLHGGITRGMGSPIFALDARVAVNDRAFSNDLRSKDFKAEHVAQYWLDDKDLRLVVYRERAGDKPHGYVELVIYSRAAGDEISYDGTYELTIYDVVSDNSDPREAKFAGKVGCSVE